jgi:hypothetical protein
MVDDVMVMVDDWDWMIVDLRSLTEGRDSLSVHDVGGGIKKAALPARLIAVWPFEPCDPYGYFRWWKKSIFCVFRVKSFLTE